MLTLQNLDLDTHVKLKKNEILEKELHFYNSANNSIQQSAAVLAGFAFSGLSMSLEKQEDKGVDKFRTLFVISSTICVGLNLVTLCAATFASLYSVRLALRGADDSVENSVKSVRGEYKFVLSLFCAGIFAFFSSIAVMGFYKYDTVDAYFMLSIGFIGILVVFFLLRRASKKFYLSKSQRYLSNKTAMAATGNGGSGSISDVTSSSRSNYGNIHHLNHAKSPHSSERQGNSLSLHDSLPYTRKATGDGGGEKDTVTPTHESASSTAPVRRKSTLKAIASNFMRKKSEDKGDGNDNNLNSENGNENKV